ELGPLLFPAVNDVLSEGVLDLLGPHGSRLVTITEIRLVAPGRYEVGLKEVVGLQGERMAPQNLTAEQAESLVPNRIAILWPGRAVPLMVNPLLDYRETELADEVLFLNCDRSGKRVEYINYATGRTETNPAMSTALAELLGRVTGRAIDAPELERLGNE